MATSQKNAYMILHIGWPPLYRGQEGHVDDDDDSDDDDDDHDHDHDHDHDEEDDDDDGDEDDDGRQKPG